MLRSQTVRRLSMAMAVAAFLPYRGGAAEQTMMPTQAPAGVNAVAVRVKPRAD